MAFKVIERTKGSDSSTELDDQALTTFKAKRSWTISGDSGDAGTSSDAVRSQLQSSGLLPDEGSPYPDNSAMYCQSVSVSRVSPIFWEAVANYKSSKLNFSGGGGGGGGQPWDSAAKVDYRTVTTRLETDEDFNGNPIVNPGTAEPIRGVTRQVSDTLAIITKPFLVFSGPTIDSFRDTTNDDTYLGYPPGRGLVNSIIATSQKYDGYTYYNVTAEILFRFPFNTTNANAWYFRHSLKGFYEVVNNAAGQPVVVRATDDDGFPVTQPVWLDGSGYRIAPSSAPEFTEWQVQGSSTFSNMGFF
jgi:hypothetical protein